jgi:hypothetical protein
MSYDILAISQDQSKIAQLTGLALGGVLSNGTGVVAAAPVILAAGVNTITVATPGTFVITMPSGSSCVVATGTGAITGSPVTILGGVTTTVTFTGVAAQNFTVTVTVNATAEVIEIPGIRTIQAVIGASLSGGYKLDPAACSWAGNKVTIQPQYFDYAAVGAGAAISVPTSVDLSAILLNMTVIGY